MSLKTEDLYYIMCEMVPYYFSHNDKIKQGIISEIKALKTIYKYASNNTYMWYLSLIHPKWVKPHSYWVKIKEILHLK